MTTSNDQTTVPPLTPRPFNVQQRKAPVKRAFTGMVGMQYEPRAEPVEQVAAPVATAPIIDAAMAETIKQTLTGDEAEQFLAGAPTTLVAPTTAKKVPLSGKERAKRYRDKRGAALREKERLRKEAERLEKKVEATMATPEFNPNRGMSMTDASGGKGRLVSGGYEPNKVDKVIAAHDAAERGRRVRPKGTSPSTDGGKVLNPNAQTPTFERGRFKVKLEGGEETQKGQKMAKLGGEVAAIERDRAALEQRRQSRLEGLHK